jgi:hypothetical protein
VTGKVFAGQLSGNGYSARCLITVSPDGDEYLSAVVPPVPDGEYDLFVNGLTLKVRQTNGDWKKIDPAQKIGL